MNNHHKNRLNSSLWTALALCTFATLGWRAVQGQATIVTSPSQLFSPVQTAPYPTTSGSGASGPSSFTVTAGTNTLTYSATNGTPGGGFQSYTSDLTVGPQFGSGNVLEELFNGSVSPTATGPLQISFQNGVTGFGLFAQDFNADTETFTLTVFNGNTSLGSFTFGPTDNTSSAGTAVFVGAQTNVNNLITRATISSTSSPATGINSNDFYVGPASVSLPCAAHGQTYNYINNSLPCCAGFLPGPRGKCVDRTGR